MASTAQIKYKNETVENNHGFKREDLPQFSKDFITALMPLGVLTVGGAVWISLNSNGVMAYFSLLYGFVVVPFLEILIPPLRYNSPSTYATKLKSLSYLFNQGLILLMSIAHLYFVYYFITTIGDNNLDFTTWFGRTLSMGLSCGILGINIAHELGHRQSKGERWLAQILLATSLYMHFYIEHNKGHHRHVSTPQDPASARFGENLYRFWWRSIKGTFLSALSLDRHHMIAQQIIHISILTILIIFSPLVAISFFISAVIGFLLLETVNYIEHYGLSRNINPSGRYEKVTPIHSWNSDHILGRSMLFNLSRHSDHHANAHLHFPLLRHFQEAPQMPTGYPGMMLLATIPVLWFRIMNSRVEKLKLSHN